MEFRQAQLKSNISLWHVVAEVSIPHILCMYLPDLPIHISLCQHSHVIQYLQMKSLITLRFHHAVPVLLNEDESVYDSCCSFLERQEITNCHLFQHI